MSQETEGLLTHRILRTFEELSVGFQARGASKSYADHHAMVAAFRLEGWPRSEAEKFARIYLPKDRNERSQTS
jgi:hypothetical protein